MFKIVLWILGAVIVGGIGAERTCGFLRAFFLSLFLSPIIGGIMVAFCPKKKSVPQLLSEAKVILDSGVVTEDEYREMVDDITKRGKMRSIRYYKKGIVNPFRH